MNSPKIQYSKWYKLFFYYTALPKVTCSKFLTRPRKSNFFLNFWQILNLVGSGALWSSGLTRQLAHYYDATPRVVGSKLGPSLFFVRTYEFAFSLATRYGPTRNANETKTRKRGATRRREGGSGEEEEEELAGVPGMVSRKVSLVRFEIKTTIKWWTPMKNWHGVKSNKSCIHNDAGSHWKTCMFINE